MTYDTMIDINLIPLNSIYYVMQLLLVVLHERIRENEENNKEKSVGETSNMKGRRERGVG